MKTTIVNVMEGTYPSKNLQITLVLLWSIILLILDIGIDGPWTIQTLLLNTSLSNYSSNAVDLTNYQYELYVALPYLLAALPTICGGFIVDFFGMPTCLIIFSCCCLLGLAIESLGVSFTSIHTLTVIFLVCGESLYIVGYCVTLMMRCYVSIIYFDSRWKPIVSGVLGGATCLGFLLANLIAPKYALTFGVPSLFWLMTALMLLVLLIAIIIYVMSKLSDDFISAEKANRDLKLASTFNVKSTADVLRSFQFEFWLVFVEATCLRAVFIATTSNSVEIHRVLFGIPIITASYSTLFGFLTDIIVSTIFGFLCGYTNQHALIGLVGSLVGLSATLILLRQWVNPLLAYIFYGFCDGILYSSVVPILYKYVPTKFSGMALSFIISNGCVWISSICLIFSVILSDRKHGGTKSQWIDCITVIAVMSVTAAVCNIILVYRSLDVRQLINKLYSWSCKDEKAENGEKMHLFSTDDMLNSN